MTNMNHPDDILRYNRDAWDRQVERGNPWTVPVGPDVIARARQGDWQIILTPTKPVPADWFPPLASLEVLCLASGGGQQGPILAVAGAKVTVFDNSPGQLAQDRLVADREGLMMETIQGDMADLSVFPDGRFDLIVHPVSNVFAPDVKPVWREAYRVLRPEGSPGGTGCPSGVRAHARRTDRRPACGRVRHDGLLRGHRSRHDPGKAHPLVSRHEIREAEVVTWRR
jgi:SAM-dependent methyltransferase